jgi:DNA-binding MarR family transcriptional regulator
MATHNGDPPACEMRGSWVSWPSAEVARATAPVLDDALSAGYTPSVGSRVPWVALATFRHYVRRFLAYTEDEVRKEGLEPAQHHLLLAVMALSLNAGPTIGELSEQLVRRHHSTVELVDRLETSRLVRRVVHASDRRKVCVELTPQGLAVLERLTAAMLKEYRVVAPELVRALRSVIRATSPSKAARAKVRR